MANADICYVSCSNLLVQMYLYDKEQENKLKHNINMKRYIIMIMIKTIYSFGSLYNITLVCLVFVELL